VESRTLEGLVAAEIFCRRNANLGLAFGEIVWATYAVRAVMAQDVQTPHMVQYGTADVGSPVTNIIGQRLASPPAGNDAD
jgi:hypothetical protein